MWPETHERTPQTDDSMYLFLPPSTSYPPYAKHFWPSLRCDLHFPRIHYWAVAIWMAFIPQVAAHTEIRPSIPGENIAAGLCSTNRPLHRSLLITSFVLCVKSPHHGIANRGSQLCYKCPPFRLRWSCFFFLSFSSLLYFSPMLFFCHPLLGDGKRLERRKSFF